MAPLRSGNIRSAFDDYARTGKDAVNPYNPDPPESSIIPFGLDQSSSGNTDFLNRNTLPRRRKKDMDFSWIKKIQVNTVGWCLQ